MIILKVCSKCKLNKEVSEYNLHSKKKGIPKPYCKSCQKIYDDWYMKSYNGLITTLFKSMKSSTNRRGHSKPTFTKEDFRDWLSKNNYEALYNDWAKSGFDRYKRPSVDRLDDTKTYIFENMQLTNWFENDKKYKDTVKIPIKLIDIITGEELEFESVRYAARKLGLNSSSLSRSLRLGVTCYNKYKVERILKK